MNQIIWVDSEVHLLPPEWCSPHFTPQAQEAVMRRMIYDHPERERALSRATVEGLLGEMEAAHIDRAVIMGMPWHEPDMCWRNNAYIAEVVLRYPRHFIGLGVLPPPDRCNLRDAVRRVAGDYGLRGVKVIPSWQGYRLHDQICAPALDELLVHDLVLVPHTDQLFLPPEQSDTAYGLYMVGQRYPELRIMAPHLGGLLCLYALHEPVKPALQNMLFVTTVPASIQMVMFAVDAVGAEQLCFGTDFPFNPSHDQHAVREAFEALPLSLEHKRLIAGQNVLRFFGETI